MSLTVGERSNRSARQKEKVGLNFMELIWKGYINMNVIQLNLDAERQTKRIIDICVRIGWFTYLYFLALPTEKPRVSLLRF